MANFKFDVDADGIALVTWDMPGRSMNVITAETPAELSAILDKVVADAAIKGAVVPSGKDAFCGGADLPMLEKMGAVYAGKLKSEGEEKAAANLFAERRTQSPHYR